MGYNFTPFRFQSERRMSYLYCCNNCKQSINVNVKYFKLTRVLGINLGFQEYLLCSPECLYHFGKELEAKEIVDEKKLEKELEHDC